jgi:hypothetical protein
MNNTLSKVLKFFLSGLLLVAVLLSIVYFKAVGNLHPEATFAQQDEQLGGLLDSFMYFAYILTALTIILTIGFAVVGMVLSPKTGVKSLVSIAILVVIALIGWSLSSSEILNIPGYTGHDNVESTLKWSDMIIYTTYIMSGISVLALIYAEVSKLFK